ncbi:MAG TPA: iron-sulfur cluster assembly scaffold protein, partial [Methanosarcina sp.]|nr:iron-sulfur cluster assembly scaffold protein [Methanosarcina sp.]
ASSSMATEMIKGKTLEEAWKLSNKAVAEALDGLPPIKMHCSMLAEEAIHEAINDYLKKKGLETWTE